jgi:hypothetical protein
MSVAPQPQPDSREPRDLYWIVFGPQGMRTGWLVLMFYCLYRFFGYILSGFAYAAAPALFKSRFSPLTAMVSELVPFVAMLGAGAVMMRLEPRRPAGYNLRDSRALRHFFSGLVIGFLALSTLVGILAFGGWLHFGPRALSGSRILAYALIWAVAFLLVGCVEEGTFRCYGQWTLTRGINFWWALAFVFALCTYAYFFIDCGCTLGVYVAAAVGLFPCLILHLKKAESSGFWQAAWATSTGFGFVHTLNSGENWIGIFAAASIGFVFCVSIWVTGSAWWAIGCHAAWDWTETYFYGTADSGFVAPGHLFSTWPAGDPLWSGGSDGPEGSLWIVPVVLLMLVWLVIVYRRPRREQVHALSETEQLAS